MRLLAKEVRELDGRMDELYAKAQRSRAEKERTRVGVQLVSLQSSLSRKLVEFCFEQKLIEEMAAMADNVWEQLQKTCTCGGALKCGSQCHDELARQPEAVATIEQFVRMPVSEFFATYDGLKKALEDGRRAKSEMIQANL